MPALGTEAMRSLTSRFLRSRSGTTAIEYALIAGLVSIVIAAGVGAVGQQVSALFTRVTQAFQ